MSSLPAKLRLGALLAFSWIIANADGSQDTSATVSNVDLTLKDVQDADGNTVDASRFATIERVDDAHDKATMSSDAGDEGVTGTFEATATVTWPNDIEGGDPIVKTLTATGTGTISTDPSAGDTLVMEVTLEDAPAAGSADQGGTGADSGAGSPDGSDQGGTGSEG